MKRLTPFVHSILAVAMLSATVAIALNPQRVVADEGEGIVNNGQTTANGEPEVYTVTREYSVTRNGNHRKERRGKAHKRSKRQVGSEVFSKTKKGTTVRLYPTLHVTDYGNTEQVRGQVYSATTARPKDVRRMRIGGALLQWNTCSNIYDAPPIETERVFSGVRDGYSPWTNWYGGSNDCWYQTGHNYFRIILSKNNLWDDFVTGDVYTDL